ncbi:hypothetical protein [Chenggangzhangella methanolivorans]|uniref:Autotransporter domain-containing protein n=1 Tax=Chenggangzhangella methanolivorans TaxID=1437009 RepID=A0A9E6RCM1_9HYPH|nr:hypothetical protein [Chenggangzhangella methanolivorans]QZO00834.1 hypothetical protein K6K41_04005 [Chenggangzhangella methanolivorans]
MVGLARRAGLTLGALGTILAFAATPAPVAAGEADAPRDFRSTQALVEAPLFLSMAEIDAAFSRLDAERVGANKPVPGFMSYWESSGVGYGQGERAGRIGSGASTQMRIGLDRETRPGLIIGAMASAGFGGVGSGDLGARAYGRHVDFYAKFNEGRVFAKALVGASQFGFGAIERGEAGDQCQAAASSVVARASGQIGASTKIAGITITPMLTASALGDRLSGYSERGGSGAASFGARSAVAAIGAARLSGSRSFRLDSKRKLKVEAFVGGEGVMGFSSSKLKASVGGERVDAIAMGGSPTGRGLVGGLGVGTSLMEGVTVQVNYDYGRRDGVSTRATRGRLGVSF